MSPALVAGSSPRFDWLLFDLDGVILDFALDERLSLLQTLDHFGFRKDEDVVEAYHAINAAFWKRLEKGEVTQEELALGRHRELFLRFGFPGEAVSFQARYENHLKQSCNLLGRSLDVLAALKGSGYKLALVTNGFARIQTSRIALSGVDRFFDRVYISEQIGWRKPQVEFFEHVFADIRSSGETIEKRRSLIIGDSLSSDILGGADFGLPTCWVNPENHSNPKGIRVDYEIGELPELLAIV